MPAAGRDIGGATAALEAMIRAALPAGMSVAVGGAQEEAAAARKSSELVFGLALLIVFFFLSAQFESFRDPAIILMAAPFAIVGGLAGLLLSGGTLNAYTAIALVTLVGMIAKHGILITEFANQRRDEGMGFHDGLLDAIEARCRPILMTTCKRRCKNRPVERRHCAAAWRSNNQPLVRLILSEMGGLAGDVCGGDLCRGQTVRFC